MFGPAGLTNSLGDIFPDQQDDYSSFGLSGTSKEEDSSNTGNEVNVNILHDTEMPSGEEMTSMLTPDIYPLERNSSLFHNFAFDQPEQQNLYSNANPQATQYQDGIYPLSRNASLTVPIPSQVFPPNPPSNKYSTYPNPSVLQDPGVKSGSKKKLHNTSEKRRVERMNAKIDELYSIISV